jgi:acyl-CoA dehydrogenase
MSANVHTLPTAQAASSNAPAAANTALPEALRGLPPDSLARVERMRSIARDVAGPAAVTVDRDGRFPSEALAAWREAAFMGIALPRELGGQAAGLVELGLMCEALGQRCASAAMVFAMHQVQVGCVVHHGRNAWFEAYARRLIAEQRIIASVTSEAGVGGSVRTSICAIEPDTREGYEGEERLRVHKDGTVVSYAEAADDLLMTVRRTSDAAASDQALVMVDKADCQLQRTSTWDAMGMRGTCSPGYIVDAHFLADQIVPDPFGDINAQTMVPWAHILWASAWLGIATDAVQRARGFVRDTARKLGGATPPTAARLSEVSARLQLMRAQVRERAAHYDALRAQGAAGAEVLTSVAYAVQSNHLKVNASELVAEVCTQALRITGTTGYRNDSPYSVARHLRDAHSAALMIGNERIHAANGSLHLMVREEFL